MATTRISTWKVNLPTHHTCLSTLITRPFYCCVSLETSWLVVEVALNYRSRIRLLYLVIVNLTTSLGDEISDLAAETF